MRKLVSRNAPFDRFAAGNDNATSQDAKRGLKLFLGKAQCVNCHNTPLFSDDDFHVIGLHINSNLSPHADPIELGRAFNQALICDSSVAGGDSMLMGISVTTATRTATGTSAHRL